jgi:glycosyltransferase involved in cell wall biosynthesis
MTGRKIHILCRDGSPLGVTEKTMRGEDGRLGVGGAELALLTMAGAWQYYGNDVTLYNDPKEIGASSFRQLPLADFHPHDERDILIIFRSPNHLVQHAKGKKIWWSCDSYTIDDFSQFRGMVEKVVCISPHHAKYFKEMYGITDGIPIDLPVRTWEYRDASIPKIPKRCIFTSIPDRGVMELHAAWPRIHAQVPEASLVITSDWRLWADWCTEEQIRHYKLSYARHPNVVYKGAIRRNELVHIQQEAEVHLYPSVFDEMFCISVAESQVAGAFPISTDKGALATTNMGSVIHGNAQDPHWQDVFVRKAVELLTDPKLPQKQEWIQEVSRKRFSIENILNQWEEKIFS